jgi:cyclopropane-fatty-acyl-phospholipid synthase
MVNIVAYFAASEKGCRVGPEWPRAGNQNPADNEQNKERKGTRMLYKFKSKSTSDLIMLEPNGRRMLEIIGKTPAAQGIVQVAQMPAAIAKLEAAIAQEQAERKQATDTSDDENDQGDGRRDSTPTLQQRALPFIDLLKRCHQAGTDLVWGV